MKINIQTTRNHEITSVEEAKELLEENNLEITRIGEWKEKPKFTGANFVIKAKDGSQPTGLVSFKKHPRNIRVYAMLWKEKSTDEKTSSRISIFTQNENGKANVQDEKFVNISTGQIIEARFGSRQYDNLQTESEKPEPEIIKASETVASLTTTNLFALQNLLGFYAIEDGQTTIEELETRGSFNASPKNSKKEPESEVEQTTPEKLFDEVEEFEEVEDEVEQEHDIPM